MEIKFAQNLKELRIEHGLSQAQLGQKLGVNQRTVSAWEKGICEPSFALLIRLCEIFDETIDSLLL